MLEIREILDHEGEQWNEYVQKSGGSIYYYYGWKNVFEKAYTLKSIYLAAFEGNQIKGILPSTILKGFFHTKLVSLPFVYHGGPFSDNSDISDLLIQELRRVAHKLKISNIQIRMKQELNLSNMHDDLDNVHLVVNLKGNKEETLRSLKHTARKHIKKSLKYGFETKIGMNQLEHFYRPYQKRMKELGTPCHSIKFWKAIANEFPLHSNVITVWDKDTVIAGMFCCYITEKVFCDVLAISLREYRDSCSYYFLHWQAIQFAIDNGCRTFDFERSQKETGTYKFKKQWGADEFQLYYYSTTEQNIFTSKERYKHFINIWKKQPLILSKMIGPLIRKYIP